MAKQADISGIWQEYHRILEQFVRNKVNDREDVNDILQDIFLKIRNGISGLESGKKIHSWIFTIARNTVIDHYRKYRRVHDTPDALSDMPDIDEATAGQQIARGLLPMLAKLPAIYREALFLSQYKSMTNKEIALKLNISVSAVKSRVQRGRSLLKNILLDCCKFELDVHKQIIDFEPHEQKC